MLKEVAQIAATSVRAAVVADNEVVGGRYVEDCAVASVDDTLNPFADDARSYALDTERARQLWEKSHALIEQASV